MLTTLCEYTEFFENSNHLPIKTKRKPLLLLQLDPSISKFEFDEEKEPVMELPPAPAPPIPPGANPDLLPEFL